MAEENKQVIHVGDRIRKTLFELDLRIVQAEGELQIAKEEYYVNQKINTQKNQRLALEAKMKRESYSTYVERLKNVKKGIENNLNRVLSTYIPRYKRIWVAYFIEKKSYDEIAVEVNYTRDNVKKVVSRLKEDLIKNYELGEK